MGFGSFEWVCRTAPLPLCVLLGTSPECYARNIELANTLIFQSAADVVHIVALAMGAVMLSNIRAKYTAVGRREIAVFFRLYLLLTIVNLVLDSGVVVPSSTVYPFVVAAQCGLITATCWCLLLNGFVAFQFTEDGTRFSLSVLRISSLLAFMVSGGVAISTFRSWLGLSPNNSVALFVLLYIITPLLLLLYGISQVILVLKTLSDRWPLFDVAFGALFFILGQVVLHFLSSAVCSRVNHYLDGIFFVTVSDLLAVMMVYKFWDSITKEDLEFSVSMKANVWEVKDPALEDDHKPYDYCESASSLQTTAYMTHYPRQSTSDY